MMAVPGACDVDHGEVEYRRKLVEMGGLCGNWDSGFVGG